MHTYLNQFTAFVRRNIFALSSVALFATLFCLAILHLMYEAKIFVDQQMAQDIEQLSSIFQKIDQECRIIAFAEQKNAINFLNVKTFIGSELGPMHLMFPDRWKGPFLRENLSVFGKPYLIVRTKHGFFITPPMGVQLGNGKTIGVDITLAEACNIPDLMKDPNGLRAGNRALAAKINTTGIRGPLVQTFLPDEE